jgi:hypothetical protein
MVAGILSTLLWIVIAIVVIGAIFGFVVRGRAR